YNETEFVEEPAEDYMKMLLVLNRHGVLFEPEEDGHLEAVKSISKRQEKDRKLKSMLANTNPDVNPTGQLLKEAFEGFTEHVEKQYTDHEGNLSPWGSKQIGYVKSIVAYIKLRQENSSSDKGLLVCDLADLTLARCQEIVDSFRFRPKSIRSNFERRLQPSSAINFRKALNEFWDWLDLSDEWEWSLPRKFSKLNSKIDPKSEDEAVKAKTDRENWEITDEEIKVLFQCCTPVERVLLLLGLNCAFGGAEIGGLRVSFLKFETSEIDGIRFKTQNSTRHRLWPETIEALQWELARRESLPKIEQNSEIVFLTKNGARLWRKSKSGNYQNGIKKRWEELRKRVTKDDPSFRQFGFSRLRKTAAIRILKIADAEAASLILAHGVPTDDDVLKSYISIPWDNLYAAQEEYGDSIRELITTEFDPFAERPKTYLGHGKRTKAVELRKSGRSAKSIAEELGINVATVYRYLKSASE
ncbi:helix-turn-helix domain-containing protein, partial [Mariniblastus sp.]|nr:helix-turn-helix domain-containing protein [Mariniblastus sp.]